MSKKGVNGIGVPTNHCEASRSTHAVPAAFEFVPSVYGGSDGRAQALPVHASGSRYANLSELPPSIGVGGGGFSKPNHLEANMAATPCALAPSLPITGPLDPIQLHAYVHNALNMAVFYLRQPQANTAAARRKAIQALSALRRLTLALEG